MNSREFPAKQGLYDPDFEHDSCGIGFVVNVKGARSNSIVRQALAVLKNLEHRGACGCEANTGDGAGILFQLPHAFFEEVSKTEEFDLPSEGDYGVGMVFLCPDPAAEKSAREKFESVVSREGQTVLGWREVPTDNSSLGETATGCEPAVRQAFVGRGPETASGLEFERKLYVIRKRAESEIRLSGADDYFYVSSLSCRTVVYKGMLTTWQLELYFPDLANELMESSIALVHSRFSTNTFPSWDRAHPYRYVIHNGEINTLRGNINWMRSRQAVLESGLYGNDIEKIFPVIAPDGSDSASFDNALEFLSLSGYSIERAVMMMIPEPWSKHRTMPQRKKDFYRFHGCLLEPWDGPASIAFTDGKKVGAVLDRNGLRPTRYYVTEDDTVILGSEVGVLEVPPERVKRKGRLLPGRMLLIDTTEGRIVGDEEIKERLSTEKPYGKWLADNMASFSDMVKGKPAEIPPERDAEGLLRRQRVFGYTFEDLRVLLGPMSANAVEPVGAMGVDIPLAALSDRPRLLYGYFKQMFAQVTNPAIDAIREELVTGTVVSLGAGSNILAPGPQSCARIELETPFLTNPEIEELKNLRGERFRSAVVPMLFNPAKGAGGLEDALCGIFARADREIEDGADVIILSDRDFDARNAPVPALLAVSGLHHHLIRNGNRMKASIVVDSGEPREVHHMGLLIGYGASAVCPYMAYETLNGMIRQGMLPGASYAEAVSGYVRSLVKGIVKIMSKIGISTVQSYHGAQIFEALGLDSEFVEKYFTWTVSRIRGVGIDVIAAEAAKRHSAAFEERKVAAETLDTGGVYRWRPDGERHMYHPRTVHALHDACRSGSYEKFREYSRLADDEEKNHFTLRGLMELRFAENPVPLEEVEPVESICRRFKTGAMSYGAISREAHESLAVAMNRIGAKSNTGEGGEDADRFTPDPDGDLRRSAIKQVASGRFGVTSEYLVNSDEIQIKIAQGAKPGEGGQLPGKKVYPWIAKVRLSTPGVGLISPPPHHDIYSIEDLAQLIYDLKNANSRARINVKLVSESGVGTIAAGVAKGHADVILVSGTSGGTGASPHSSIQHAGLPWELGIAETHQTLLLNNLRSRVVLETDGQMKTGRDIAVAALLGAEEYGFSTAPLIVLGCIMMRVCHLDTCPVGVATQNPELRAKFDGDPAHVVNFMRFVAAEFREIMAKMGFRTVNEMVGRSDRLEMRKSIDHWKARGVDLSGMLFRPRVPEDWGTYRQTDQDHGLEKSLDETVLKEICRPAIESGEKVEAAIPIRNVNRTVGTIVGSELTRRYGLDGLEEDTVKLRFSGSAGQSFGAFVPPSMTLVLEGDANDYIGKGLSGGKIIVYPPAESTFVAEENVIIGNVAFYGATGGEAYVRGIAGERFCVRNSGVRAVVEAVGDHGCEYMTGGRVVVAGPTGRNFAAGMSGGVAYVYDPSGDFEERCNTESVFLEPVGEEDAAEIRGMLERHLEYTGSEVARSLLSDWSASLDRFVKVMPRDYKRMLAHIRRAEQSGLSGDEALMAAFEENKRDLARVSGN